jgi:hypothetical protein
MVFNILFSFFISIIALTACVIDKQKRETIEPKEFKTAMAFEIRDGKLFIPTYWGKKKAKQLLAFDTHAPTWADSSILNHNNSVSRVNNLLFRTTTIDGAKLTGSVYKCDSIRLGSVRFDKVIIYNIPSDSDGLNTRGVNAVFGDNLISMGVWKIDFENSLITFASSLDSIDLQNTTKLPVEFSDNIIRIDAVFPNGNHKKLAVDLGYNGSAVLSRTQFAEMNSSGKTDSVFNILPEKYYLNSSESSRRISIANRNYPAILHFSEAIKESLLGLGFFLQFKFVILDYRNKSIYVSNEVGI